MVSTSIRVPCTFSIFSRHWLKILLVKCLHYLNALNFLPFPEGPFEITLAEFSPIMLSKHVIIFFVIVAILIDPCTTSKAKKNKGSKNKGSKTKGSNELPKPAKIKAPYVPDPDQSFYPPGGRVWSWDEDRDSPFHNDEFQEIWNHLRETTVAQGTPQFSSLYFNTMKKWLEYGLRVAYVMPNENSYMSTIYAAHLKTENGTNVPPILGSTCSLEQCSDPYLSYDFVSQIDTQDLVNFEQPTEIEQTYDDFVSQWFRLTRTLSQESAKNTICRAPIVGPTKRTVSFRLDTIEQENQEFLDDPGRESPNHAKYMLRKAASGTTGKLLLNLMAHLCKGVM